MIIHVMIEYKCVHCSNLVLHVAQKQLKHFTIIFESSCHFGNALQHQDAKDEKQCRVQMNSILLKVYNYFSKLELCGGS